MRKEIESVGVAVKGPNDGYWGAAPDGVMGWVQIEYACTRHPSSVTSPVDFAVTPKHRELLSRGRLVRVSKVTVFEVSEPQDAEYSTHLSVIE